MWNRNRATSSWGDRAPLPHVISGHAGYKEGGSGVQPESGHVEGNTLTNWVVSAVEEHDDQKKHELTFQIVREMFWGRLDDDIVLEVLIACNWQENEAIEQLFELAEDTSGSSTVKSDNRHTLEGIANWLGGKSQCGLSERDFAVTGGSVQSNSSVYTREKAKLERDSATPLNFEKISYLEAAKSLSTGHQSVKNCSISNLRDFNSANSFPQNSAERKVQLTPPYIDRASFPDLYQDMAKSGSFPRGGVDNHVDYSTCDWTADKDEIYMSDDNEEEDEACAKVPTELGTRSGLNELPPFQHSQPSLVSHGARNFSPWMSGNSFSGVDFHRSVIPAVYGVSSANGSYLGPEHHANSHLDEFVMPLLPVQMSSHYSPVEPKFPSPASAYGAPRLDSWSAVAQNSFSPGAAYSPVANSTPVYGAGARIQTTREIDADETVLSLTAAKSRVSQRIQTHKVLVLLRGCPGSGKSTMAKQIKFSGAVLSADDYFERSGKYEYDVSKIGEAHASCKQRALRAMRNNVNPVIIDNTNTQAWEMIPYVEMAIDCNYCVEVIEPDVPWRKKASQLANLNSHAVPAKKLQSMLSRYEYNITAKSLLDAVHKKRLKAFQASTFKPSAETKQAEKPEEAARSDASRLDIKRRNRRKKKNIAKDSEQLRASPSAEEEKDAVETKSYPSSQEAVIPCDGVTCVDLTLDSVKHGSDSFNDGNVRSLGSDIVEGCNVLDGKQIFAEKEPETREARSFNLSKEKTVILEKIQVTDLGSQGSREGSVSDSFCSTDVVCASENTSRPLNMEKTPRECDEKSFLDFSNCSELGSGPDVEILEEVEIVDSESETFQDASFEVSESSQDTEQTTSKSYESCLSTVNSFIKGNVAEEVERSSPALPIQSSSENRNSAENSYWSKSELSDDSYAVRSVPIVDSSLLYDGDCTWAECESSEVAPESAVSFSDRKQTSPETEKRADVGENWEFSYMERRQTSPKKQTVAEDVFYDVVSEASGGNAVDHPSCHLKWQMPSFIPSPSRSTRVVTGLPKAVTCESSAQTEPKDLTAAYRLENDPAYEDKTFSKILTASPRVIFDRESAIISQRLLDTAIPLISKRDISTMIDDSLACDMDSKIAFLRECFPTVTTDDLQYLLSSCGDDVDLTVNSLLDFGYEYNEPRQSAFNSSPESLVTELIADDKLTANNEASAVQNKTVRSLKPSRNLGLSYKLYRDSVKPKLLSETELQGRCVRSKNNGTKRPCVNQSIGETEQFSSGLNLVLSLTPGFAAQLVELFGPICSNKTSELTSEADLNVDIDVDLAQQIHAAWTLSRSRCRSKADISVDRSKDLKQKSTIQQSWQNARIEYGKLDDFPDFFPKMQPSRPVLPDPEARSLSTKLKRQKLKEQYPMINSAIIDEIFEATGYSYDVTARTIAASTELIAPPKTVMTRRKAEEMELELIQRAIAESLKEQYTKGASDNGRFKNCDEVYEDLMSEAAACFKRHQDCLQQAQTAHCKRMHPAAMHYSQEAHSFKQKFQEAKLLAAEMIMQTRLSDLSNLSSIDLHGLTVSEALHLLKKSLSQRENELLETRNRRPECLYMITGRGSHSHGGIARIKPAVEAYLKRNNYSYSESTPGVLKVRLHVAF